MSCVGVDSISSYKQSIRLHLLTISTCVCQLCCLSNDLNSKLPGTLSHYSFLESVCRILEWDSCTVSDTSLPSLSLSQRSSLVKGISGDSYSLGTIPSTDDSKKLKSGNHIRVLFESLCIRAWLLASVW